MSRELLGTTSRCSVEKLVRSSTSWTFHRPTNTSEVTATARAVSRTPRRARRVTSSSVNESPTLPRWATVRSTTASTIRVAGDQPVPDDGREEREEGDDGNEGNSPRCIVRNMPRWAPTNAAARAASATTSTGSTAARPSRGPRWPSSGQASPRHPRERVTDRRRELFEAHRVGEAVAPEPDVAVVFHRHVGGVHHDDLTEEPDGPDGEIRPRDRRSGARRRRSARPSARTSPRTVPAGAACRRRSAPAASGRVTTPRGARPARSRFGFDTRRAALPQRAPGRRTARRPVRRSPPRGGRRAERSVNSAHRGGCRRRCSGLEGYSFVSPGPQAAGRPDRCERRRGRERRRPGARLRRVRNRCHRRPHERHDSIHLAAR